ncbi:MAG: preprotein translocase subunit SecG [bacterium JZ-2024 1]
MWNVILVIHFLAVLVLIIFTVSHVSRREGISGLGGLASETMRAGKGFEETMKVWAKWAAYTFLASSILLWYFYERKL